MIIGLSGKKQHGKDTVADIIHYLIYHSKCNLSVKESWSYKEYRKHLVGSYESYQLSGWSTVKFATKLKQIAALLIGCTVEQLENNDFKEKELDPLWECWIIPTNGKFPRLFPIESDIEWISKGEKYFKRQMTPRMLLQLLGTDCGRDIIHPNIWVNALMSEYKDQFGPSAKAGGFQTSDIRNHGLPKWIITDVRFPNEVLAIANTGGIMIRVERPSVVSTDTHPSETALDNHRFDYTITNDGTIDQLIEAVRQVLIDAKII
jgi:hypothetical protein